MKPGTWLVVAIENDHKQYEATVVDMLTLMVPNRVRIQNDVEKQGVVYHRGQYQVVRVLGEMELAE